MTAREIKELEKFAADAEKALREAVHEVIEEHRRTGMPLAVMRDGKATLVSPNDLDIPIAIRFSTRSQRTPA